MSAKSSNRASHSPRANQSAHRQARAKAAKSVAPVYDAGSAKAALESLRPELESLAPEQLAAPRLDVERATVSALGAAEALKNPELADRFRALPSAEFDSHQLEKLGQLAWACWFAQRSLESATAAHSGATLPLSLVQEATELKRRMQRCTEYHLAEDADAAVELAQLRAGTGHLDLARDLAGYAELYRDYVEELRHDQRLYEAKDAERADALATTMLRALGRLDGTDEAATWARTRDRAFTLLERCYADIAATAAWLFRYEPERAALFPSLYTASRRPRRTEAASALEPEGESEPTVPTAAP